MTKPVEVVGRGIGVFVDADSTPLEVEVYTGPEDFCQRIYPELVSALGLYTGTAHVGEELAQETLTRVWARWDRVATLRSPRTWAFRVGFNLANSWWRRQRLERRHLSVDSDPGRESDALEAAILRTTVAALPRRQRAALVCRYFVDLSVVETAELMGCAPGTVKSLTSQAISALRRQLLADISDREDS